jgi:hypothetical protein
MYRKKREGPLQLRAGTAHGCRQSITASLISTQGEVDMSQ